MLNREFLSFEVEVLEPDLKNQVKKMLLSKERRSQGYDPYSGCSKFYLK